MKTIDLVKQQLEEYPFTRNSDRHLILRVWAEQGLFLSPDQKELFLHQVSTPETIRRIRQKLQQQGLYPCDPEVDRRRYEQFKETRQDISFTNDVGIFN